MRYKNQRIKDGLCFYYIFFLIHAILIPKYKIYRNHERRSP